LYVLVTLAFKPFGGSLVSLIPDYKTGTGNLSLGIDVSQSLNSGWVSYSTYNSYILSSSTIQLTAK